MSLEELRHKFEDAKEAEDIGEKRFQFFKVFDQVLSRFDLDSVKELDGFDGYLYKLSQDFLISSSTYQKELKLEKIVERMEEKYSD